MDSKLQHRIEVAQALKTNFPYFARNCLKILTKGGNIIPLVLNKAQLHVHERIEDQLSRTGKVRALVLKGRQQGACLPHGTKVMTADYQWTNIEDVRLGDHLFSFDEDAPKQSGDARRMRTAEVEAVVFRCEPCIKITFVSGKTLTLSEEHKMLMKQRGGTYTQWRKAKDYCIGDHMRRVMHSPSEKPKHSDWAAGAIDADGSIGGKIPRVGFSQVDGPVLDRYKKFLADLNVHYYECVDHRKKVGKYTKLGDKPVHCVRIDKFADVVKLFSVCDVVKSRNLHEGRKLPTSGTGFEAWDRIIKIESVGVLPVVDLQTSTKTFIAEGYASHNSTYVEGRFYWKTSTNRGRTAYILTHEDKATSNLFGMAKRYHDYMPAAIKPVTSAANANELVFSELTSRYMVGTAGSKATGRSSTVQLFHASEVGFWANAIEHMAGIGQTVPDEPGTEVIMESTGNGIGNLFHGMWQDAVRGISDYIPIFVPWYWEPGYRNSPPSDWMPSNEASEYGRTYGIDLHQLYWRERKTLTDFRGESSFFDQEFPATSELAFRRQAKETLLKIARITQAMEAKDVEAIGPKIMAIDPAESEDGDDCVMLMRQGRCVKPEHYRRYHGRNTMEIVGLAARAISEWQPDMINVDAGGLGSGVADRLIELGYRTNRILFGERAIQQDLYGLRRDEMWGEMVEWFKNTVSLPNDEALKADLAGPLKDEDSSLRFRLESKKAMKKRGLRSPDGGDALCLSFAVPVSPNFGKRELRGRPAQNWRVA